MGAGKTLHRIHAHQFEWQGRVFENRAPRQQVGILKDEGGVEFGVRRRKGERAAVWRCQTGDDAEERRFPATRRPEDSEKLAGVDTKGEVVDDGEVAEGTPDAVQTQGDAANLRAGTAAGFRLSHKPVSLPCRPSCTLNNNKMFSIPIDWSLLGLTALKIGGSYILALPTGFTSEKEGHAVGLRTFPIVAMASCGYLLAMGIGTDPDSLANESRVLQGLVAGIGFVGGGAILKEGMSVHGTATAASIWNTGAIGAAIAMGHYEIALVLAALNLFTMRALSPIKKRLDEDGR